MSDERDWYEFLPPAEAQLQAVARAIVDDARDLAARVRACVWTPELPATWPELPPFGASVH